MLIELFLISFLQLTPPIHCYLLNHPSHDHKLSRFYRSHGEHNPTISPSRSTPLYSSPIRIYFDITVEDEPLGRLVFKLENPKVMPLHTENLIKLSTGERRSIDPRCSYDGCRFKYSSQFIEGLPQYRWAHILDGRGFNAVGSANERIQENPLMMRACTHSTYGGVYYGLKYEEEDDDDDDGSNGVVLTVPLVGAYRGSTSFSIVRVGESPQEWKERLLLNSAVLGRLESGVEVLRAMARQTNGPPKIIGSGTI